MSQTNSTNPQFAEDEIFSLSRKGDVRAITALDLSHGRLDEKDAEGETPLVLATTHGNLSLAQYLLSQGADPDAKEPSGETVLMGAARRGDLEMVKLLIQAEADPFLTNAAGETALDLAKSLQKPEIEAFLGAHYESTVRGG
jgi:ankyrin repeat protein